MSLPKDLVPDPQEARRRSQEDPLVAAAMHAAETAGVVDCPDAERLGLYAESELGGDELALVRAHVDGCARCLAVVAAYRRASEGAPERAAVGAVAGATTAGGFAAWFSGWRWLVPVASLAAIAVVAVWVGRGPRPGELSSTSVANQAPQDQLARTERDSASAVAPAAPVPAAGAAGGSGRSVDQRPTIANRASPAATAAETDRPVVADLARQVASEGQARAAEAPAATATPPASAAAPPPAAVAPPPPARMAEKAVSAEAEERSAAMADTLGAVAGAAPPAETRQRAENAVGRRSNQAAAGPADVRAGRPPLWRVRDGRLEFARDGRRWRRVTLPTTERVATVTELPDGSVVATSVSGARFVTTDIGTTWRREQ